MRSSTSWALKKERTVSPLKEIEMRALRRKLNPHQWLFLRKIIFLPFGIIESLPWEFSFIADSLITLVLVCFFPLQSCEEWTHSSRYCYLTFSAQSSPSHYSTVNIMSTSNKFSTYLDFLINKNKKKKREWILTEPLETSCSSKHANSCSLVIIEHV